MKGGTKKMANLLERLSTLLSELETAGGYELAEGGQMCRAFAQREALLTLDREGQAAAVIQLTGKRDWASLKKLALRSPFADVRQTATVALKTYFPNGG